MCPSWAANTIPNPTAADFIPEQYWETENSNRRAVRRDAGALGYKRPEKKAGSGVHSRLPCMDRARAAAALDHRSVSSPVAA